VAQNIGLGAHPRRGGVVDYGRLAAAVAEIGKELDLIESPDTPVERLPLEPRSLADKVLILAHRRSGAAGDNDGTDHGRERRGGMAQRNSRWPDSGYAAIVWPRPVPLNMRAGAFAASKE
jgi:hypothetical protein